MIAGKNENRDYMKEAISAFFLRKCFCAMDYNGMIYLSVCIYTLSTTFLSSYMEWPVRPVLEFS